jgi:DNA-binding NarL/FixJ family response regulator
MKRREVTPSDRAALLRAARSERAARARWDDSLDELEQAIKQASANGASLREIAQLIGRSHGRVRDLVKRQ